MMDVHHILLIDIYINLSVSDLFNNLDNAQMREQHLLLLLSGVLPWIDPPDVISKEIEEGRSGRWAAQHSWPVWFLLSCIPNLTLCCWFFFLSEMIDGCRALLSIGTVTTPVVFDRLLRSLRSLTYNLFLQLKAIWWFFIHKIVVLSVSSGPLALLHSYLC